MKFNVYNTHAILRLFGGEHTYPVILELNWAHLNQPVYHGPFYDRGVHRKYGRFEILKEPNAARRYGYRPGQPLLWGTGGLIKLQVHPPSEGWRLWVYSRWGSLFHIDIFINRRKDAESSQ